MLFSDKERFYVEIALRNALSVYGNRLSQLKCEYEDDMYTSKKMYEERIGYMKSALEKLDEDANT